MDDLDTLPRAGIKRPRSETTTSPHKKRKVHHFIHHVQHMQDHTEPAPQDPVFTQGQLLKSIAAGLAIAGFDSVKPSALEMFRAHTEEYMLHFLADVRSSMQATRRTRPLPEDFSLALARDTNTNAASKLRPMLDIEIPEVVSYPPIHGPDPLPAAEPDLSALLGPLTSQPKPHYVPSHFPSLPSKHTWHSTPVFADREKDARKIREKATEEGVMAEQALRKLAAAQKAGVAKNERRRSSTLLRVTDVKRDGSGRDKLRQQEDVFGDMWRDVVGGEEDVDSSGTMEMQLDGASDLKYADDFDLGMPEGVVVNHNMGHWRKGGGRRPVAA